MKKRKRLEFCFSIGRIYDPSELFNRILHILSTCERQLTLWGKLPKSITLLLKEHEITKPLRGFIFREHKYIIPEGQDDKFRTIRKVGNFDALGWVLEVFNPNIVFKAQSSKDICIWGDKANTYIIETLLKKAKRDHVIEDFEQIDDNDVDPYWEKQ